MFTKNNETPYYLDEHDIIYRKIGDRPNIDCTILLEDTIIGKSCINIVTNTYVHVQNANQ